MFKAEMQIPLSRDPGNYCGSFILLFLKMGFTISRKGLPLHLHNVNSSYLEQFLKILKNLAMRF
jgi:hypothetical protein